MTYIDAVLVILIGALVGTVELVSRYRDAPTQALLSVAALVYIVVNAAAAYVALALIDAFGLTFGATESNFQWVRILVAGFGAMALFRSSFFMVNVGDTDVGVGPSSILQTILLAADRGVDRQRARRRAWIVDRAMSNLASFDQVYGALPTLSLALMQNVTAEEQAELARQIATLKAANMDDRVKLLSLGLALMNVVGEDVLLAAVASLGSAYTNPPPVVTT